MFFLENIFHKQPSFSPYANIITMIICVALFISLVTLPEHHGKSYKFMLSSCASIFLGGFFGSLYFCTVLPAKEHLSTDTVFMSHFLYYFFMMTTLLLFLLFIMDTAGMKIKEHIPLLSMMHGGWLILLYSSQYTHAGFWIGDGKRIHENYFLDIYTFCFIFYLFIMEWIIMSAKKILYSRVKIHMAFIFTFFAFVNFMQALLVTDTLVNPSFLIPLLYFLLIFRQNSYNRKKNCMDRRAFVETISDRIKHKKPYHIGVIYAERLRSLLDREECIRDFKDFCNSLNYKGMIYDLKDDRLAVISDTPFDKEAVMKGIGRLYETYKEEYKGLFISGKKNVKTGKDMFFIINESFDKLHEKEIKDADTEESIEDRIAMLLAAKNTVGDIAKADDDTDDRVRVFCQPIYDTKSGKILSAESLMRLYSSEYGFLFPSVFIPLAEKYGQIHSLSMIIFTKVCRYLSSGEWDGRMTVNFSTDEFLRPGFTDEITGIVRKYGIAPSRIGIEITESRLERDFDRLDKTIKELRNIGFFVLIDDFGTGYSNLSRIFSLPVNIIKFDRSLLLSAERNGNEDTLKELVSMFKHLGMKTLCEGIETENDKRICTDRGFDYLQGYLYSRPIPIENLRKTTDMLTSSHG